MPGEWNDPGHVQPHIRHALCIAICLTVPLWHLFRPIFANWEVVFDAPLLRGNLKTYYKEPSGEAADDATSVSHRFNF